MKLPPETAEADGPNLTPVIDVVFLLLIFFLVATTYDQQEREIDVQLPEVTEAQPLSMTDDFVVNISREGRLLVVGQEYSERQLLTLVSEAKRNNPQQNVLIYGDGESSLKHAARVMGLCNQVGMNYRLAAIVEH